MTRSSINCVGVNGFYETKQRWFREDHNSSVCCSILVHSKSQKICNPIYVYKKIFLQYMRMSNPKPTSNQNNERNKYH